MIEWLLLPAEKMAAPATAATLALFVCGMVAGSAVTTSDPAGQSPVLQSPCRPLTKRDRNEFNFASEVNSGDELSAAVKSLGGPSSPVLLQLNVINGTQWLHLGGSLDTFDLVLGRPPSTSSDMNLAGAVAAATQGNLSNSGLVISFSPQGLVSQLEDKPEICAKMQTLPLWLTQSPESAEHSAVCSGKIPPNMIVEKSFGIDSILARVSKENLMLPKDYQRLLATIDKAYLGSVPGEDARFIRTLYRRLEQKQSFTDLFLASLLQVLDKDLVIREGDVDILPDLHDTAERYSTEDFADVERIVAGNKHECHLITLRAGVLVSEESLNPIKELTRHPNVLVIAYAKAYDMVAPDALANAVAFLGGDRVILQLASQQLRRDLLNGGIKNSPSLDQEVKIPVPTTNSSSGLCHHMSAILAMPSIIVLWTLLL